MSGATGNPQWHEGQIAQNPSNTARRNPKPDKHHVESRDNLVEISEESPVSSCIQPSPHKARVSFLFHRPNNQECPRVPLPNGAAVDLIGESSQSLWQIRTPLTDA